MVNGRAYLVAKSRKLTDRKPQYATTLGAVYLCSFFMLRPERYPVQNYPACQVQCLKKNQILFNY